MSRLKSRPFLAEALPLAVIVVASAAATAVYVLEFVQYTIMPDELGYVKQAVELAHGDAVTPGNFWFNSWALLHPAMMAPFYRWASTPAAFDASHLVNTVLMASTAVPVYLLARLAGLPRAARLLVAALSVGVPWMAMAATVMTEPIAYPAFAWAVLAMCAAIAAPSARHDLLLLLALGVAFLARTQLLVLGPAFVLAAFVAALARPEETSTTALGRLAAALRAHRVVVAAALAGFVAVLLVGSADRILGGYAQPTHGSVLPAGTWSASHELLAYVAVGVGGVPLALAGAWVTTTLAARSAPAARSIAAVTTVVTVLLIVVGGAFSARFAGGLNDRYAFYVVPLLLVAGAACLLEERRGYVPALAGSGAAAVLLIATAKFAQEGPTLVTPSAAFHVWLAQRADDAGDIAGGAWMTPARLAAIATAFVIASIVVLALRRGAARPVVAAVVGCSLLVYCVAETAYTFRKIAATQHGAAKSFVEGRDWIDRSLPRWSRAATILGSIGDQGATTAGWWDTNFWNKTIDRIYTLPGGQPFSHGFARPLTIDEQTGRVPTLDDDQYFVHGSRDARIGFQGSERVVETGGAIEVIRAERPYRLDWLLTGADPDSSYIPPGTRARLRVFGPPGAHVLAIALSARGEPQPLPFAVAVGGQRQAGRVPADQELTVTIPARFRMPGFADVRLSAPADAPGAYRFTGVSG